VGHMEVTKTMLISLVTPVIAVIVGMLALHEEMNWRTIAGGVLIIAGLWLIRGRRKPAAVSDSVVAAEVSEPF